MSAPPSRVGDWGSGWMIRLRWLAVFAIALAPWLARPFGLSIPTEPFLVLAILVATYNALLQVWILRKNVVPELGVHAQILADLLALTAVIHFSGGAQSPVWSLYALHVVIAAIVLSRRSSFFYASLGLVLLGGLLLAEARGVLSSVDHERASIAVRLASQAVLVWALAYLVSVIGETLRRRERDLVAANRRLARQDRHKSQYVLMLAHRITGRLKDVGQGLHSAMDTLPPQVPESTRGMLKRVQRWLSGLDDLMRDVLNLSRIRAAGEIVLDFVYFPRVVQEAIQELRPLAREKDIELAVETPDSVPPVRGNAAALSQAVENLLRNAVFYSHPRGRVRLGIAVRTDWVELTVEDEGLGIPEAELPHIFEEFYRGEQAQAMESAGTGLGLAIVKYVADLHGGEVDVQSQEGKGSRFVLRVPLALSSSTTVESAAAS